MNRPIIVAVDFDGILCKDKFPKIGEPNYDIISFVRRLQDSGVETILWTSRVNDRLAEAVAWCEDRGLHFTSINDNTPSNKKQYGTNPRKVYADVYIDDRTPYMMYRPRPDDLKDMEKQVIYIIKQLGGKLI